MTRPSPYQIKTFASVARQRSFTKAAQHLGVSQSSVTQQINKLEKIIGAPLFIRRREGLEFTRAGRDLNDMSQRYASLDEAIVAKIAQYQDLAAGHLKIIATTPRPALPLIQRFSQQFPKINIDLSLHSRTVCQAMMSDHEADLGIIIEPECGDDLLKIPIRKTSYKSVMSSSHYLASRQELRLQELCEERIVMPEDASFTQQMIDRMLATHGLRFSNIMKMQTFPLVKEAILHGVGIGFFLDDSVFPASSLKLIPIRELTETYTDYVVVPQERQDFQTVKEFIKLAH